MSWDLPGAAGVSEGESEQKSSMSLDVEVLWRCASCLMPLE